MDFELPIIAPSILSADYTQLGDQIRQVQEGGIQWIHCDIMDGHFVPNISFGPDIVTATRIAAPEAFLDVHLMIENPDALLDRFVEAGADLISVHQEACIHLHRTLSAIRDAGVMTGVAINPATPVSSIEPILGMVDLVVIMSVNPGFGGQSFITETLQKAEQLAQLRVDNELQFLIEFDGGVTLDNCQTLIHHGADVLVAGSAIFKTKQIAKTSKEFIKRAKEA